MNSKKEAFKLIIENIQMFDEATRLFEEFDQEIFDKIDNVIKEEIEQEWVGAFNLYNDTTRFLPSNWLTDELDHNVSYKNALGFYEVDIESNIINMPQSCHWWLSTFFKNPFEKAVFTFQICYGNSQIKENKNNVRGFLIEKNQEFSEIQEKGFSFDSKELRWYLPIEPLDNQLVISCYENDNLEEAMQPIRDAVRKILEINPIFNKILQELKTYKKV